MEDEQIEVLIRLDPAFPWDDLEEISRGLSEANVFVPVYVPPAAGLYDLRALIYETHVDEKAFWIYPDRNLASRMAKLARGDAMTPDRWSAAAVMAFAQCLNMNFEPSLSFHELAHRNGNASANEEFRWFRTADAPRPQEWIDLALGRRTRLDPVGVIPPGTDHNLAKPLRRWRRNYVVALHVAELELAPGPAIDKVLKLLDWMFHEFILAGPAALFSSLYFAPSARRRGMFKQLRSPNRDVAIAGVKNAAWDITYVSELTRQVELAAADKRILFATSDRSLSQIATMLFGANSSDPQTDLACRLRSWWPKRTEADQIAHKFFTCVAGLEDPRRRAKGAVNADFIDALIAQKEARLRAWVDT